MLDLTTAAALAADMQTLISHLTTKEASTIGYEAAHRILTKNRDILKAVIAAQLGHKGVEFDATNGGRNRLDEAPDKAGKVFLVKFSAENKGAEAHVEIDVGFCSTRIVIIPARESRWTPRMWTPYRVRLTRLIGKGRTRVWLCTPVGAQEDEKLFDASREAGWVYEEWRYIGRKLDEEAIAVLREYVAGLDLPKISVPAYPNNMIGIDFVEWGDWVGDPKATINPRANSQWLINGRRVATWKNQTGIYDIQYTRSKTWIPYDNDGIKTQEEIWIESTPTTKHISGNDVIAKREAAVQKEEQEDWPRRKEEAANSIQKAHAATAATMATIKIPKLPAGNRINTMKTLEKLIYDRISG